MLFMSESEGHTHTHSHTLSLEYQRHQHIQWSLMAVMSFWLNWPSALSHLRVNGSEGTSPGRGPVPVHGHYTWTHINNK